MVSLAPATAERFCMIDKAYPNVRLEHSPIVKQLATNLRTESGIIGARVSVEDVGGAVELSPAFSLAGVATDAG